MASSATYVERGYAQLEPNRLSGITFGNIEAQAPAYTDDTCTTPIATLENGQFLCVVPATDANATPFGRVAVLPGEAEETSVPYLVFSERKQYDEREEYCDFVDRAADKVDGKLFPRLVGLTPDSCVFTLNGINATTLAAGDILYIGDDGFLTGTAATNKVYQFAVTKVYTMPDGQKGVKVMCQKYVATT